MSGGVGEVNESDVMMASTASKLIIAFNVITPPNVKQFAKNEGVKISSYRVIYELLDDIKQALEDLLPPLVIELTQGKLEVLQVFSVNKKVTIAGGKVVEGKIDKGADVRVIRKGEEVSRIKVLSIHRGKDEVPFCQIGTECGLGLEGKADVEVGDEIIAYSRKEQKQTINVKI